MQKARANKENQSINVGETGLHDKTRFFSLASILGCFLFSKASKIETRLRSRMKIDQFGKTT